MAVTPAELLRYPHHALSLGLGSGLSPWAPGTAGSALALLPAGWFVHLPGWQYGLLLAVSIVLGVWLCGETARALGVHDHPAIVWDEFAGLWLALFWVPHGVAWLVLGFGLFRLFDVWKPWPIRWLDRHVHGGSGIMLDDLLAGALAWGVLQGLAWWLEASRWLA